MNSFDNYNDIDYDKPLSTAAKIIIGCLIAIVPVCYFVGTFVYQGI